jgi:hypothetical protein
MVKKLIIGVLAIVLVALGVVLLQSGPQNRFNVSLSFIGSTNLPNGSPAALVRLQNRDTRVIFYDAWGRIPKYGGEATLISGETNYFYGIRFHGVPADLPPGSNVTFDVELPTNTLAWKITVDCWRPDSKGATAWRIHSSPAGRFVPNVILGGLFQSTRNHGLKSRRSDHQCSAEFVSRPVIPRPH